MRETWTIKLYKGVEADPTYKYLPRYIHRDGEIIPAEGSTLVAAKPLCQTKYNSKVIPDRKLRISYDDNSSINFEDLYNANYVTAKIDSDTVNFCYGGFVNNVTYMNNGTVDVDWTIDYWATYGDRLLTSDDPVIVDRSLYGSIEEVLRAEGQTDSELPVEEPTRKIYEYQGKSVTNDKRYKQYYILYCRPTIADTTNEIKFNQSLTEVEDKDNELSYKLDKIYSNNDSVVNDDRIGGTQTSKKSIAGYTKNAVDGVTSNSTTVYDSMSKSDLTNVLNHDYTVSGGELMKPHFDGTVDYPKPAGSKDGLISGMKAYAVTDLTATFANPDLFFDGNGCKIKSCEVRYLNLSDEKPVSYVGSQDKAAIYDVTQYLDALIRIDYHIGTPDVYKHTGNLPLIKGAQKMRLSVNGKSFDYDLSQSYNGLKTDNSSLSYTMFDSIAPSFNPTYSFWGTALNREKIGTGLPPENDPFRLTADYSRLVPLFADGVYSYLFANHHRIQAEIMNKLASINAQIEARRATISAAKQKAANHMEAAKQKVLNSFYANIKKTLYANTQEKSVVDQSTDADANNIKNKYDLDQDQLVNTKQKNEKTVKNYEIAYKAGTNNLNKSPVDDNIKGDFDYNRDYAYKKLGQEGALKLESDLKKAGVDQDNLTKYDQPLEKQKLLVDQGIAERNLAGKNKQEEINAEGTTRDKFTGLDEHKPNGQGLYGAKLQNTINSNATSETNQQNSGVVALDNLKATNIVKESNLTNHTQVAESDSLAANQKTEMDNTEIQISHDRSALKASNSAKVSALDKRQTASHTIMDKTNLQLVDNMKDMIGKKTALLEKTANALLENIDRTYRFNYGGGTNGNDMDLSKRNDTSIEWPVTGQGFKNANSFKRWLSDITAYFKYNAQLKGIKNSADAQRKGIDAQKMAEFANNISQAIGGSIDTNPVDPGHTAVNGSSGHIAINGSKLVKKDSKFDMSLAKVSDDDPNYYTIPVSDLLGVGGVSANELSSSLALGGGALSPLFLQSIIGVVSAGVTGGISDMAAKQRVTEAENANIATAGSQYSVTSTNTTSLDNPGKYRTDGAPRKDGVGSINEASNWASNNIGKIQLAAQFNNAAKLTTTRNNATKDIYDMEQTNLTAMNSTKLENLETANKAAKDALNTMNDVQVKIFGSTNKSVIDDDGASTALTIMQKLQNAQNTATRVLKDIKQVHQKNALEAELGRALTNLENIQGPDKNGYHKGVVLANLENSNGTNLANQKREFEKTIENLNALHQALEDILKDNQQDMKNYLYNDNGKNKNSKFELDKNKLINSQAGNVYGDILNYAADPDSVPDGVSNDAKSAISQIPDLINQLSDKVQLSVENGVGVSPAVLNGDPNRQLGIIINDWNLAMTSLNYAQETERRALDVSVAKEQNDILNNYLKQTMNLGKDINISLNDLSIDQKKEFVNIQNDYYAEIVNAVTELLVTYLQAEITGSVDIENYVRSFNAKLNDLRSSSETIVPISSCWYNTKANSAMEPIVSFWTQQPKDEQRTLSYLQLHGLKMHVRSTIKDALSRSRGVLSGDNLPEWKPLKLINSLIKDLPAKGNQALNEAFNNGVYLR